MTKLLEEICKLPSYDLECGWGGGEMYTKKPSDPEEARKYLYLNGDYLRAEDVLELLNKHGLI